MPESAPRLTWGEVLQRLDAAGVVVAQASNGNQYLRREHEGEIYWRHLPSIPDPNLPVGPYVLNDICQALNLSVRLFDDRPFNRGG